MPADRIWLERVVRLQAVDASTFTRRLPAWVGNPLDHACTEADVPLAAVRPTLLRLRAALSRGSASDLHALWHTCDAWIGRPVEAPRERDRFVALLSMRPIADAVTQPDDGVTS